MKNSPSLFKNSLNTSWGGVFARSLAVLSLFSFPAMAQFINPTTPDEFASCTSSSVANTGTSAFGDLQVVVVDGSDPSIVFIDHTTSPPTEVCFLLQAAAIGGRVEDPDVVWDYSGTGLALVVYESDLGPSGVWSEMWDWNGGSPVPVTSYAGSGFYLFSAGATHPNVDADIDGNAVVVWKNGSDIEAMTVDFGSLTPSGNTYWVNDGACGHNRAAEPDVAIRSFGGNNYVNFVMVDQGTAAGDIVVVFESFTIVQSGFANNCASHIVQHASVFPGFAPTRVAKPRIDMNTYFNSYWTFQNPHACGVVYEMYDGTDSYVGSSQWMDLSDTYFPVPQPPNPFANIVFAQTYSQPAWATHEWISDVMSNFVTSIVSPGPTTQLMSAAHNSFGDFNSGPVIAMAGDFITYTGWNWTNLSVPIRSIGLEEVLSRRLILTSDGNSQLGATPPFNNTLYHFVIPAPTTNDYFVVGDGLTTPEPQTLLSMDGTLDWSYYAFVGPNSGRIFYKRSFQNSTAAVRTSRPNVEAEMVNQSVKELSVYPNPSEGLFEIKAPYGIANIQLVGARGEILLSNDMKATTSTSQLDLNHLPNGVYTLSVHYQNAAPAYKRIVIAR
ncbi:MAG: T9SS type A sorting domain-containing protein [Sphingobacteriaceae bacterium]|nr:T9SS type A sorting domain-containing protein [Sphingobacteriaceae bacterium]